MLLLIQATPNRPVISDPFVGRWQSFLVGRGYKLSVNTCYDAPTVEASKKYQRSKGLVADGIVGNATLNAATSDGFPLFAVGTDSKDKKSQNYPPRPTDLKPPSDARRKQLFGEFKFTAAPTKQNPEGIIIDPKWVKDHIVVVSVPAEFSFPKREVVLHRLVKEPFLELLDAWHRKKRLPLVVTFNGGYVPRFKRGLAEQEALSNHSSGGAFDINADYNPLGSVPKLVDEEGSVRELVSDANKLRWYWGGHYLNLNRLDGMHFDYVG